MKAAVIASEPGEVSLSIKETDIGILYIVQHELLGSPGVDFAGVIIKHPLTNECWMRVSSGSKPLAAVGKAADSAIEAAEGLRKLFRSKIRVG